MTPNHTQLLFSPVYITLHINTTTKKYMCSISPILAVMQIQFVIIYYYTIVKIKMHAQKWCAMWPKKPANYTMDRNLHYIPLLQWYDTITKNKIESQWLVFWDILQYSNTAIYFLYFLICFTHGTLCIAEIIGTS